MQRTKIQELFGSSRNADPFRLAICGVAALQETLNEALAEAFDGDLPAELRRTHLNVRVALAVALNLMPAELRSPLGSLVKLRNDFAHGTLDGLTPSHGRELYASL